MAEEMGEKTELPTGKRRADARSRGQVAKSSDLTAAIELSCAVLLVLVFGPSLLRAGMGLFKEVLGPGVLAGSADPAAEGALIVRVVSQALWVGAPIVLLMVGAVMFAHIAQAGWLYTLYPLTPKIQQLNPINGAKKFVSKRNAVKTAVNIVKLTVIALVAFGVASAEVHKLAGSPLLAAVPAFELIGGIVLRMMIWILALMLLIGLLEYFYQRWQLTQDLRMTKQEVKDERRSLEGDMDTKARRMRMARQMIYQQIRSAVPKADVVVTNPTHYSVAIRYDSETMDAPRVVAKGVDLLAFRIRELAAANQIPIVEKPELARALYANIDVGRSITPEYYEAVAEILAYVYRLEGRAA